jgi:hypothetical protein
MAGVDPSGNFVGDDFRTRILAVMTMGLPNTPADRPTFRWRVKPSFAVADPAGRPYFWGATPIGDVTIPDLQVVCVVELSGSPTSSTGTDAGEFTELTAKITMLDTQYQQLLAHGGRPPDIILLGEATYDVDYVPANLALFDVDVWIIMATSRDAA